MGWASGSDLFGDVIAVLKKHVKDDKQRAKMYKPLIVAFQDHDWDTEMECVDADPVFAKVLKKMHPDWFEDEEEANEKDDE